MRREFGDDVRNSSGEVGVPDRQDVLVAKLVRVTDGDTIVVRRLGTGREFRVRLIGIDTPEVYGGVECGDGRPVPR